MEGEKVNCGCSFVTAGLWTSQFPICSKLEYRLIKIPLDTAHMAAICMVTAQVLLN